jgi:hypothetical protein
LFAGENVKKNTSGDDLAYRASEKQKKRDRDAKQIFHGSVPNVALSPWLGSTVGSSK